MSFTFNPGKSAQAAAFLLKQSAGDMDKYIFIKMLYLSDREALKKWEEPITGDSVAAMQYGPVLSNIYDLTKGDCPLARGEWSPFISDCDGQTNRITLLKDPGEDMLSRAEIQILATIYEKFHKFSWREMWDYCHALKEFDDPGKSSSPIPVERILDAVGKTEEEIVEAQIRLRGIRMAEVLLS